MTNIITISELRREMGLSQSEFAPLIGLANKASMSLIETGKAMPTVDQALKIEALSVLDGVARIDAAQLNDDVAKAREACVAICHQEIQSHHGATDKAARHGPATGKSGKDSRAAAEGMAA